MTRRSAFLIVAAAILPLILLFVLQLGFAAREQRQRVENEALAQAKVVISASDAEVARAIGALDVLASADAITRGDVEAAFQRAKGAVDSQDDWVAVILTRAKDGALVFDTRIPLGDRAGRPESDVGDLQPFAVVPSGPGCPCVAMRRPAAGRGGPYWLTVLQSTRPLASLLPPTEGLYEVSALVTDRGMFIARSLEGARTVGRPATKYVRAAVATKAPSGLYRGRTYEGLANYTAFARSELTGWSDRPAS